MTLSVNPGLTAPLKQAMLTTAAVQFGNEFDFETRVNEDLDTDSFDNNDATTEAGEKQSRSKLGRLLTPVRLLTKPIRSVTRRAVNDDRILWRRRLTTENNVRRNYRLGMLGALASVPGVPVVVEFLSALLPPVNAAMTLVPDSATGALAAVTAVGIGSATAVNAGRRDEAITGRLAAKQEAKAEKKALKAAKKAAKTEKTD